jgi:RNA polymerase sigma-70 factor (ECF subfamily)
MVAIRMDRRLVARVDPSDVVQEAMAEAHRELDGYLRDRPLPFYPWLRRIAWERLVALHHRHITAKRRSTELERHLNTTLPEDSALVLADRLIATTSSPSRNLIRAELRQKMREALDRLSPNDREILVLRHLEGMRIAEIAAVLGISEGAVKVRQTRALVRLRAVLDETDREDSR